MKPDVEIVEYLLAESEQQTKQIIIKHLFDTFSVEAFDYRLRRVSLIAFALPYAIIFVAVSD